MKEEIIIRKVKVGDAKKVAELIKIGLETKNFEYIGANKPWDKKKIERIENEYNDKESPDIVFIAEEKFSKKVIGSVSCFRKKIGRTRHRGECAWTIHPDYQEKGIGTRLLKELIKESKKAGLKRLEAEMAIKNTGSWKLAKKCGFKIEGTKKGGLITDNEKCIDTYIVGKMLK